MKIFDGNSMFTEAIFASVFPSAPQKVLDSSAQPHHHNDVQLNGKEGSELFAVSPYTHSNWAFLFAFAFAPTR